MDFYPQTCKWNLITMPDLDSIPDRVKWQIAAHLASSLPIYYDLVFRQVVMDRYDEMEQEIWIAIGKQARAVAESHQLPVGTAGDIARTLAMVSSVFFGPEFREETIAMDPEKAVILMKMCPLLLRELETGQQNDLFFHKCLAFSISAVESLNPVYTLRFVRSMCMGDKNCEMKIITKEIAEKEDRPVHNQRPI
jgi:hypothetical protein